MLPCEFCEISKNTFSTEHLRATASESEQNLLSTFIINVFYGASCVVVNGDLALKGIFT